MQTCTCTSPNKSYGKYATKWRGVPTRGALATEDRGGGLMTLGCPYTSSPPPPRLPCTVYNADKMASFCLETTRFLSQKIHENQFSPLLLLYVIIKNFQTLFILVLLTCWITHSFKLTYLWSLRAFWGFGLLLACWVAVGWKKMNRFPAQQANLHTKKIMNAKASTEPVQLVLNNLKSERLIQVTTEVKPLSCICRLVEMEKAAACWFFYRKLSQNWFAFRCKLYCLFLLLVGFR